jgi:hypothetical protein
MESKDSSSERTSPINASKCMETEENNLNEVIDNKCIEKSAANIGRKDIDSVTEVEISSKSSSEVSKCSLTTSEISVDARSDPEDEDTDEKVGLEDNLSKDNAQCVPNAQKDNHAVSNGNNSNISKENLFKIIKEIKNSLTMHETLELIAECIQELTKIASTKLDAFNTTNSVYEK